jgi:2-methylcitrate dehydratase PrpD
MTIAVELWERWGRITAADLPADVATVAGHSILDWFACAMPGSAEPLSRILRDELLTGDGDASIVGTSRRTGARTAALVNGAAGHALDYDDTHLVMGGHPTVPVFPAALALAEELDRSGAELLAAFATGVEIEARLGAGIGPSHYAKGWHATSSIGIFGATAAASRLLSLDAEQFGRAIGLAASQASGLKANFGTMAKPFHAGHAAERGLLAAQLARRGFTANPDALDANQGLAQAAGDGQWRADRIDALGHWVLPQTLFKYHAACYLTHAAIEATGSLAPPADAVDRITVTVNPDNLDVCGIPRPRTGLETKFSLTGTTAFTILGIDTSDPASFVDDRAREQRVTAMIERITVATDSSLRTTQARVEIVADGRPRVAEHDTGVPATDLDAQGAKLRAKFSNLVGPFLGADAKALAERVEQLAALPSARQLVSGPSKDGRQ